MQTHYKHIPAYSKYVEPDLAGALTDEQLVDLGRIKLGLDKAEEIIEHINNLIIDTGLPLRLIQIYPLKLVSNDISILMVAHEAAEKRIKASALAAVEMETA